MSPRRRPTSRSGRRGRAPRPGRERTGRVGTGLSRAAAALVAGAALLSGCDAGRETTGPPGREAATVRAAASFPSASASMHGLTQAYDATDSVRIQLQRLPEEAIVLDRFFDFDPAAASTDVSVRVSLDEESEDFFFSMWLYAGSDAVFRGADPVTLEAGRTTSVNVLLEPVPDRLGLPIDLPPITALGDTLQLEGAVLFATGDTIPDALPTWSSLDPEVATATSDGEVVARSEGEARIVASYGGITDTVTVVVDPAVARVIVSPGFASVLVGEDQQFEATLEDANGNVLTGRAITWSSSDPSVATVDGTGLATGESTGSTSIRAEAEGVTGGATLRVTIQIIGSTVGGGS